MGDSDVKDAILRWNASAGPRTLVSEYLKTYQSLGRFVEFVDRVANFSGDLDPRNTLSLAAGVVDFSPMLRWDKSAAEPRSAIGFLFSLLRSATVDDRSKLVTDTIERAPLEFVVHFVGWFLPARDQFYPNAKELFEVALASADQRLIKDLADPTIDMVERYPGYKWQLYYWASNWEAPGPPNRHAEDYAVRLIALKPERLRDLVRDFRSMGDKAVSLFFVLPPARLLPLIEQAEKEGLFASPEDKAAVDFFRQQAPNFVALNRPHEP